MIKHPHYCDQILESIPTRGDLIFTSQGLNTHQGRDLIAQELQGENLSAKTILLVLPAGHLGQCVAPLVVEACVQMGFQRENVFQSTLFPWPEGVAYIYVTEGNTFSILRQLREVASQENLVDYIRRNVANGSTYIGASAGAMVAGVDVKLALEFDQNREGMTDFTALGLFQGTVIPHYTAQELAQFIANSTVEELADYAQLYNVEQDGVLRL